jgi:hypothetical protein
MAVGWHRIQKTEKSCALARRETDDARNQSKCLADFDSAVRRDKALRLLTQLIESSTVAEVIAWLHGVQAFLMGNPGRGCSKRVLWKLGRIERARRISEWRKAQGIVEEPYRPRVAWEDRYRPMKPKRAEFLDNPALLPKRPPGQR